MDWPCGTSVVAIGCQSRDREHRLPALEDRIETGGAALRDRVASSGISRSNNY
jgi:hypothetical protein